jgi:hypothetical protein
MSIIQNNRAGCDRRRMGLPVLSRILMLFFIAKSDALLWKYATRAFSTEKGSKNFALLEQAEIISVDSQRRRSKQDLAYGRIRRELLALLSAPEAYFASWR